MSPKHETCCSPECQLKVIEFVAFASPSKLLNSFCQDAAKVSTPYGLWKTVPLQIVFSMIGRGNPNCTPLNVPVQLLQELSWKILPIICALCILQELRTSHLLLHLEEAKSNSKITSLHGHRRHRPKIILMSSINMILDDGRKKQHSAVPYRSVVFVCVQQNK